MTDKYGSIHWLMTTIQDDSHEIKLSGRIL